MQAYTLYCYQLYASETFFRNPSLERNTLKGDTCSEEGEHLVLNIRPTGYLPKFSLRILLNFPTSNAASESAAILSFTSHPSARVLASGAPARDGPPRSALYLPRRELPPVMSHVDPPEFWETQYRQGTIGWDLGGATPAFVQLLASSEGPVPGRMLVPGCGRGYDAVHFALAGFEVTGVDHAPGAVAAARGLAATAGAAVTFIEADLFSLPARFPERFDYVLEYTCFCAINPARRPEYVEVISDVLRPGGEVLALFFPVLPLGYAPDGPPFAVSVEEIRILFDDRFEIVRLAPTPYTVTPRRGRELLGRLRRR